MDSATIVRSNKSRHEMQQMVNDLNGSINQASVSEGTVSGLIDNLAKVEHVIGVDFFKEMKLISLNSHFGSISKLERL